MSLCCDVGQCIILIEGDRLVDGKLLRLRSLVCVCVRVWV